MSQEDIDAESRARIERADELRREEAEEAAGEFNTIYVANEMFPEALHPGGYTEYRELPNIVKAAAEFRLDMIAKLLARNPDAWHEESTVPSQEELRTWRIAEGAQRKSNMVKLANRMFPEARGYTEYRELPNIVKAAAEFRLEMILKFLARLDRVNKARKDNGLAPLRYPKS